LNRYSGAYLTLANRGAQDVERTSVGKHS
jgi:hypothetical protein